jgi:naphthoate synthase
MANSISETFDQNLWHSVAGFDELTDVSYHRHNTLGVVRIGFSRPEVRNAFRPQTVDELYQTLEHARASSDVGVVLLTGNGPSPKDSGYEYGPGTAGRLHILEVQRLIRFMPKVVIALVSGWAAGGGHSLNVVCDLSIASRQHARFKQTDADVGSFDAGYGSAYLARQTGQKFAREIFFLGREYDAQRAYEMGVVNAVADHDKLESTALEWAEEILAKSPTAIRMLKYAFNAVDDGLVGQQLFAGEATRLAYGTKEAAEGKNAFLEKRKPDWSDTPWHY